ncbi:MAG: PilZ domain-containing protein [Polyangiaceae bacterium]
MTAFAADDNGRHDDESEPRGERRGPGGRRVHFEALVAVGDVRGGFEAESVDVSTDGMRLRTAYLPAVGERLLFRFEGMVAEVTVEGEVLWRVEEERGGEFAVRFIDLDAAAIEAVRGMCASTESPSAPAEAPATARGARVRLHIEGLGSPMRARVRASDDGEVLVGSNLEFLRVGRGLEIEDVEKGVRREAYIDSVKVDVDPATSVPQLVVALRFGAAGAEPRKAAPSARMRAEAVAVSERVQTLAGTPPPPTPCEQSSPSVEVDAPREAADAGGDDEDAEGFRGRGAQAARAGMAMAGRVGPALAGAGARARVAMQKLIATVQSKRAERADAKKAAAPRRMTAPPPTGALKSEGRRLVREDESDGEAPAPASRINKRAMAIGGVAGLAAVVLIIVATRGGGSGGDATTAAAPGASVAAAAPAQIAAGPAGALSANVPLFGATPLSTTEAVPPPAPEGASAGLPPPGEGDEEGGGAPGGDGAPAAVNGAGEFGNGEAVKNATTLRIKADGPIEGLNGAAGAMGFTVSLPGRRALSAASELQRKDKRIESLQIVNNAHGAEVTVRFKDGVPPYLAKLRGDRLEIALGNESSKDEAGGEGAPKKKVASKGKKKHDGGDKGGKGAKGKAGGKKKK